MKIDMRDIIAAGIACAVALPVGGFLGREYTYYEIRSNLQAAMAPLAAIGGSLNAAAKDWNEKAEAKKKEEAAFRNAVSPWAMKTYELTGDPRDVLKLDQIAAKDGTMCGLVEYKDQKATGLDALTTRYKYVVIDAQGNVTETGDKTNSMFEDSCGYTFAN